MLDLNEISEHSRGMRQSKELVKQALKEEVVLKIS